MNICEFHLYNSIWLTILSKDKRMCLIQLEYYGPWKHFRILWKYYYCFFFVYFMYIPKRKYNNKLKSNIKLKKYTTIISINTK